MSEMPVKLMLAFLMLTTACCSAQLPEHSSILKEKAKRVRLILLDPSNKPISAADVELSDSIECVTWPCPAPVRWTVTSNPDGSVMVPRNLLHETTLVGTRTSQPRELKFARWDEGRKAWTLRLMGRFAKKEWRRG